MKWIALLPAFSLLLAAMLAYQIVQVVSGHNLSVLLVELVLLVLVSLSSIVISMNLRATLPQSSVSSPEVANLTQTQLIELLRRRAHKDTSDAVASALGGAS